MAGLPYDRTPTPEPAPQPGPSTTTYDAPAGLDMALDDYINQPPQISDQARDLMGRMGKGKVYLLEESTAIINLDGQGRIRGDPRIAALAEQLDLHDPSDWLYATSAGAPSMIRPSALFVRSDLIKRLSTAKVFTWTTGLGADPMGIEWLNDETLLLLFRDPGAALLALSLLAKAGFDPAEGDDPLLERSAHSIPVSLLPQAELDPADSKAGTELLGQQTEESGPPRRRGRGTFAGEQSDKSDLPSLVSDDIKSQWNLAEGIDPNARIAVRYAVESDGALRKEAKQSEWYKRHGRQAGKEKSSTQRGYGREQERDDLSWQGRGGADGDDFRKRIGRERRGPYDRPPREGRGGGRKTVDDLDQELEKIARRRAGGEDEDGMDVDVDMDRGQREERRPRRQERKGKDDLDKELEDMFAARTAAPA